MIDLSLINFALVYLVQQTYFLEVGARVSLKAATKVFFRGKKVQIFSLFNTCYLKQKRGSAIKAIYVFRRILVRSITYFLDVSTVFLKIKNLKNSILEAIILK